MGKIVVFSSDYVGENYRKYDQEETTTPDSSYYHCIHSASVEEVAPA